MRTRPSHAGVARSRSAASGQGAPRILVIRLDRLGDVVLSTPVLQALREAYPDAFIAMMVKPACREIVEGHPSLDAVICYDKDGPQQSVLGTVQFARTLRGFRFETAVVLHPTNRSHWVPWLARIPRRIGYNRKTGWLLTDHLPHRKQEGKRHEAEYALELLGVLGLDPERPRPLIRLQADAQDRLARVCDEQGIRGDAKLVAIHPSASCISKRWMPERFAQVADRLIDELAVRIILVAGPNDTQYAKTVEQAMRHPPINLAGVLSVGELACLLQRCRVLLSNDSGPVHVAAAVGTPVVDIFGRNQRGLSPTRWGPLGSGHIVLHKEVGCKVCLAHNCDIEFKCLTELGVEEVYTAVAKVLRTH